MRFNMDNLPAPLQKFNKEFVAIDGHAYQIRVELIPLAIVEEETKLSLQLKLTKDTMASAALDILGIKEPAARLEKFTICRYGGFDDQPDIDLDNNSTPEYFDCGDRGTCKVEGKLCHHVKAENGYLTPREIEVIKLIAQDLLDKQIADKLGISYHTATTHRTNIQHKIGAHSKNGITKFAILKNIT
jgi:DNA-binding CsgD family transcriptional regulator